MFISDVAIKRPVITIVAMLALVVFGIAALLQAMQEIRDEISSIRNDLPAEMEAPVLTRFDPNDLRIMSLTLTSPRLTNAKLTRIVDHRPAIIQGPGDDAS